MLTEQKPGAKPVPPDVHAQCCKWAQLLYNHYLQNVGQEQESLGRESLTTPSWLIFSLPAQNFPCSWSFHWGNWTRCSSNMDSGISGSSGQNTNINTNSTPIPAVLPLFSIPNYEFFSEKDCTTISYIIRSCFFISRNGRLCFREVVGNTRNVWQILNWIF